MRAARLGSGPIIHAGSHPSIGTNIQGPSLIEVPAWVSQPLGRYYLYFADHKGRHIRLAYADELTGPWEVHEPGALQLADSRFPVENFTITEDHLTSLVQAYEKALGPDAMPRDVRTDVTAAHIASPDVHVDHTAQRIVMYFHGLERIAYQCTRVATSTDGITFAALPEVLGPSYFRAFRWREHTYALAMPGRFFRSADGLTNFSEGPKLFDTRMRHSAVHVVPSESVLQVFWTQVGDAPERIYLSTIDLNPDWMEWVESPPTEILRPEHSWEGADQPVEPSVRSDINVPVNQLRDPALFEADDGQLHLLYACAGEAGIALARLDSAGESSR